MKRRAFDAAEVQAGLEEEVGVIDAVGDGGIGRDPDHWPGGGVDAGAAGVI